MPTVLFNAPFPPAVKQVASGSGTLLGVHSTVPNAYRHRADAGAGGAFPFEASFFDGDPNNGGTKLCDIAADDSPALNVAFTHGLYVRQTKGGELNISFTS
jgi:hypothetical protein